MATMMEGNNNTNPKKNPMYSTRIALEVNEDLPDLAYNLSCGAYKISYFSNPESGIKVRL